MPLAADGEPTSRITTMTKFPETFTEATELVRRHCKGSDTPEQTVNRLFRKHLAGRRKLERTPDISEDPPVLSAENTKVFAETKSKQEFVGLTLSPNGPHWDCDAPILIVRYRGIDCIMDGSHRCRHWKATNDQSEHTACVLVVS
jgi:hypothetical protein